MDLSYHRVGEGEPLVLIHGIGSRWQMWESVLERLAAERDVIAIDLPGFGASPMPHGTPAGIESLTSLVSDFLDSLGLDRPHVAGNSLGGWISLELAKLDRVRSATGLSPAGFHNSREAAFQRASLAGSVRVARALATRVDRIMGPALARRLLLGQLAGHPERIPSPVAADHLRALAAAPWFDETLKAITTAEHFTGGEHITVPVTIAWGERDRLLIPRQARRAQRAIPHARVLTLRDCGHVPTYDDPEQVARVLLDGSAVSAPLQSAAASR